MFEQEKNIIEYFAIKKTIYVFCNFFIIWSRYELIVPQCCVQS